MRRVYRLVLIALSVATGGLFILFAVIKLLTIQCFETSLMEFLPFSFRLAEIVARLVVVIEAGLGMLLILHLYGKNKWTLRAAFAVLILFAVYSSVLWVTAGNSFRCGYFDDPAWLRPSGFLVENILLLVVVGLLIRYHEGFGFKWIPVVALIFLFAAVVSIYTFFPLFKPYKVDLSVIQENGVELSRGKHVVAFLSPFCSHCRDAAVAMYELKKQDTSLPFFMVIGDTTNSLEDFWRETHSENILYKRLSTMQFFDITGGEYPFIMWINNGCVERSGTDPFIRKIVVERWLK